MVACRFAVRIPDQSPGRFPLPAGFVLALLLLAFPGIVFAEEPGPPAHPLFPGIAIFSLILAAIHMMAPSIRRLLTPIDHIVRPAGGGLAIGYVFYHLLPELDRARDDVGRTIFVIALASFVAYYGLASFLARREEASVGKDPTNVFNLKLAQLFIYNWLIVYGIPAEVTRSHLRAILLAFALARHLLQTDYTLGLAHPKPFDRYGRQILALSPIVGWLTVVAQQRTVETTNDIFVALLAGALLYTIFSEDLPEPGKGSFWYFAAGALGFVASAALPLG